MGADVEKDIGAQRWIEPPTQGFSVLVSISKTL